MASTPEASAPVPLSLSAPPGMAFCRIGVQVEVDAAMVRQRLTSAEIAEFLASQPTDIGDLVVALRDFVLRAAPAVDEAVRFHALCYFKPGRPFGAIGGNVCMITPKSDCVRLEFIHGAALPDSARVLQGAAKSKRHVELRRPDDIRPSLFRALIRAALTYEPSQD